MLLTIVPPAKCAVSTSLFVAGWNSFQLPCSSNSQNASDAAVEPSRFLFQNTKSITNRTNADKVVTSVKFSIAYAQCVANAMHVKIMTAIASPSMILCSGYGISAIACANNSGIPLADPVVLPRRLCPVPPDPSA